MGRREKKQAEEEVAVIGQESEVSLGSTTYRPGWKPAFLRPRVLAAILTFVFLQIIGLVVLYVVSKQNYGILPVSEPFHSLWKYGPTAVLTVTVAIWLQVEYRTKQFVPWSALFSSPSNPRRLDAVAIDYFSPWSTTVFVVAARRRHFPVSAALLATWLLQLAVIFSTGLLERQQQPTTVRVDGVTTMGKLIADIDWRWSAQIEDDLFNALVVANSSLSGESLDLPPGTTLSMVYQPVVVPTKEVEKVQANSSAVRSFTATVKYVQPDISCRPVHDALNFSLPIVLGERNYTFQSGGFALAVTANYSDNRWPLDSPVARMVAKLNLTATPLPGANAPSGQPPLQLHTVPFQTPVKSPDLMCAGEAATFQFGCGSNNPNTTGGVVTIPWGPWGGRTDCVVGSIWILTTWECRDKNHTVSNFTSTLTECRAENKFGDAKIRLDGADGAGQPTVLELRDRSKEAGVAQPGRNLPELVWYIAANAVFRAGLAGLMIPSLRPLDGRDAEEYTSFARISSSIKARYPTFASQVYSARYVAPEAGVTDGSVEVLTERLSVQVLACALLLGLLGGVCLVAAYLLFAFRRDSVMPSDPASMVGTAVVLSQAPQSAEVFAHCRDSDVVLKSSWPYHGSRAGWWQPWGATKLSRWLTVALVASIIIAVEVSYQISSHNEGVATASIMSLSIYTWTYVPAFVINAITFIVLCIEFNLRVLQPYVRLARGGPAASDALFENHVFGLLPGRLWRLGRARSPAAGMGLLFVTLATVFAGLSSIVVGDLFTFSGIPGTSLGFQLVQLDKFNTHKFYNWSAGPDASGGLSGSNRSFYGYNLLHSPPFATDAFAIPRLALKAPMASDAAGAVNQSVAVVVPAVRGRLNCTILEGQSTSCSNSNASLLGSSSLPCTNWAITVPPELRGGECTLPTSHTMQFFDTLVGQYRSCWKNPAAFAGKELPIDQCTDLDIYHQTCYHQERNAYYGTVYNWFDPYSEPKKAPGCAGLIAWGRIDFGSCEGSNLTFAVCNPYLEIKPTIATLSLPGLALRDVRVLKGSEYEANNDAIALNIGVMNISGVSGVLQAWGSAAFETRRSNMSSVLFPPGGDAAQGQQESLTAPFEPLTTAPDSVDGSTSAAEAARRVTREDFIGTDPASRQRVLDGLEHLWATTMARVADDVLRVADFRDEWLGGNNKTINGVLADYASRRVVQDHVSTRLLQGLYGGLLLCLLVGFFFPFQWQPRTKRGGATEVRTAQMLPFPPTSIAAGVKLLAGSNALPGHVGEWGIAMPQGVEGCCEEVMWEQDTFGVKDRETPVRWWGGDVAGVSDVEEGNGDGNAIALEKVEKKR